jgi:hypothetical protein
MEKQETQTDSADGPRSSSTALFGEWIAVKDRLPEGEEVICWDGDMVTTFFPCTGSRFEDQPENRCEDFGITHWMPMPNPPNAK